MHGPNLQDSHSTADSSAAGQLRSAESEKIAVYANHAVAYKVTRDSVSFTFNAFSPDALDSFMESEPFCDLCYALFSKEFGWRGGPFRGEGDCLTTLPFVRKGENPSDHY